MPSALSKLQERALTWIICMAILLLSCIIGYQQTELYAMSDKYVKLERYKTDTYRIESGVCRIESKLDRLIERANMVKYQK